MEESEKRRERLKAMRMEAAEVGVSNGEVAIASSNLSNPLLNCAATPSALEDRHAVSRFDFYTDPMSAFSSSKKRNNDGSIGRQGYSSPLSNHSPVGQMSSSHSGARNPNMSPQQFQINYSPDQRSYETPLAVHWRTPTGVPSPFSGHRATSTHYSGRSPSYGRGRIPDYGYGSSSPKTNSGRGNYRRFNSISSPGLGRTNGRGRGYHAFVSAREQPERFYRKSMVEDPWRFLKPVVQSRLPKSMSMKKVPEAAAGFSSQSTLADSSWLPKSLSMKKVKVPEVAAGFSSQSSLADCLSHAFEEAVEDVDNK
eukprot:TRINITY_DN18658_c0_g2_i1.p1 TRINITY_DN18658_c0_g2~~TRINITY_DN18658_c0_g2_i1.p1  ORF type:complete len:311 (-),score=55.69 TRINITY_DN18658_c0_g2_i1:442-1374(-)